MITTTPGLRSRPVQPLDAAPTRAPSPGAAASSPNVADPPPKCSRAIAGNSAAGIPKIIALVSTASMPPTTRFVMTYRRPSAIDLNPGLGLPGSVAGGSGLMNQSVSPNKARQAVSIP